MNVLGRSPEAHLEFSFVVDRIGELPIAIRKYEEPRAEGHLLSQLIFVSAGQRAQIDPDPNRATGLEIRRSGNRSVGSNPTPSVLAEGVTQAR